VSLAAVVAGAWGVAIGVALLLAWQTKVGPVLVPVSDRHGLHLGDVAAALVCAVWAGHVTRLARRGESDRVSRRNYPRDLASR
jgi:hypothetical protein